MHVCVCPLVLQVFPGHARSVQTPLGLWLTSADPLYQKCLKPFGLQLTSADPLYQRYSNTLRPTTDIYWPSLHSVLWQDTAWQTPGWWTGQTLYLQEQNMHQPVHRKTTRPQRLQIWQLNNCNSPSTDHWHFMHFRSSVEGGGKASNWLLRHYIQIWKTLDRVNLNKRKKSRERKRPSPFLHSLLGASKVFRLQGNLTWAI